MRSIAICFAVFCILLGQRAVTAQDKTAHEHLKQMDWIIGDWEAETEIPPGRDDVGEAGAKMVVQVSWRWMVKRDFIVLNLKQQIGEKSEVGREIVGWDAKSGQLVHWLFWEGGKHGKGEWSVDGDKLLLNWSIIGPDNKESRGRSHLAKVDEDTWTWRGTDQITDGKPSPDWPTMTFKRKKKQ